MLKTETRNITRTHNTVTEQQCVYIYIYIYYFYVYVCIYIYIYYCYVYLCVYIYIYIITHTYYYNLIVRVQVIISFTYIDKLNRDSPSKYRYLGQSLYTLAYESSRCRTPPRSRRRAPRRRRALTSGLAPYIYIYILCVYYLLIYLYIYIYTYLCEATANLPTKILHLRGFDPIRILILRG